MRAFVPARELALSRRGHRAPGCRDRRAGGALAPVALAGRRLDQPDRGAQDPAENDVVRLEFRGLLLHRARRHAS